MKSSTCFPKAFISVIETSYTASDYLPLCFQKPSTKYAKYYFSVFLPFLWECLCFTFLKKIMFVECLTVGVVKYCSLKREKMFKYFISHLCQILTTRWHIFIILLMDKTQWRQQLGKCENTSETMEFPINVYLSTFNCLQNGFSFINIYISCQIWIINIKNHKLQLKPTFTTNAVLLFQVLGKQEAK